MNPIRPIAMLAGAGLLAAILGGVFLTASAQAAPSPPAPTPKKTPC